MTDCRELTGDCSLFVGIGVHIRTCTCYRIPFVKYDEEDCGGDDEDEDLEGV